MLFEQEVSYSTSKPGRGFENLDKTRWIASMIAYLDLLNALSKLGIHKSLWQGLGRVEIVLKHHEADHT